MAWSYSGNPAESGKDEIRFLIGDTNPDSQQLQDEEIAYILVMHPQQPGYPNYYGAALAARTLAGRYTDQINKTVGSLSIQVGEKRDRYAKLAEEMEKRANSGVNQVVGEPILGGGGKTYLGGTEWFDEHSP